ncbi:MAG: hypothetical protein HZA34_03185 [Candidatus Pacebacteria bacterium]|nr:hypothetical protein [Candidatus Paceibacterota bacterium]
MGTATQRIEGYVIITEYQGKSGSVGYEGEEQFSPAFSEETAKAHIESIAIVPGFTCHLQVIQEARYVGLASGQVIDNGPKKPHSSS